MKTKNFKRSVLRSNCERSGVSPYIRTEMLGVPTLAHRDALKQARLDAHEARRAERKLDRERQRSERHLPWTLIGAMLRANPSLSLDDAKHIASSVTQWSGAK